MSDEKPPRAAAPDSSDPWGDGAVDATTQAGVALDVIHDGTPRRRAPQMAESAERLLAIAREHFSLGDFSGALANAEKVLKIAPADAAALELIRQSQEKLMLMYESRFGGLHRVPRIKVQPDEIMWLNLDYRSGFVLAQIDGVVTFEELLALSGMTRFETFRILAQLFDQGVLESVVPGV